MAGVQLVKILTNATVRAPFQPSGRVHRRREELPSILGCSMRTPRNLPSTGWTSEDEALYYTAQVFGGLLSGVSPQRIRRRIATEGIGEDLVVTGPCRRELARQSGDANCAVGKTPRHASTPTTGDLAVGNSVGRQKAKRKNAPKWRPLDSGSMYLSMKAIYFQTTNGLSPWPYDGIDYAHMVGRESLSSERCEKGTTAWSIEFSLRGLSWLSFCGHSPGGFLILTSSISFRPNGDRGLLPEGLSYLAWAPSDLSQISPLRSRPACRGGGCGPECSSVGVEDLAIRKKRDVRPFSST